MELGEDEGFSSLQNFSVLNMWRSLAFLEPASLQCISPSGYILFSLSLACVRSSSHPCRCVHCQPLSPIPTLPYPNPRDPRVAWLPWNWGPWEILGVFLFCCFVFFQRRDLMCEDFRICPARTERFGGALVLGPLTSSRGSAEPCNHKTSLN